MSVSRRDFTRLLALSGSVAFVRDLPDSLDDLTDAPLPSTPAEPDEEFWKNVRSRFLLPKDLAYLNAANICPPSFVVIRELERATRVLGTNPSSTNRAPVTQGREASRKAVAEALRVAPEEIVLTRNASEANNLVSSGLQLGPGDEVVAFGDNHRSNLEAWQEKAKRFGYTVVVVPTPRPHPGAPALVALLGAAMTPRTKVLAITHVTNTVGDRLPVGELCRMARGRGVLSMVDGAQTFGVMDVDLREMQPDFYSGSAHKWLCAPWETGVLYVNRAVHDRIHPSIVSFYGGAVGISRTLEAYGQRDEAALAGIGAAVGFQRDIGSSAIEARVRALTQRLMTGLAAISGVDLHTSTDPGRSANVVTFKPAALDAAKVVTTLYDKDHIVAASNAHGVRLSPHFYNTTAEIDRAIAAIRRYVTNGI